MTLEQRINMYYDALTQTDKDILYILSKIDFKKESPTVSDIAAKAHVSTTSVHRAIKKIGFKAYTQFKYALMNQSEVEKNPNNYNTMITHAIQTTLETFDSSDLISLFQKLEHARNIYVFGTGNEQQTALHTFSNHFMYYGKPILQISTLTDLEIYSRKMNESDVIIFCSLKGEAVNYKNVLQTLKIKNTETVSITALGSNPLSQFCKHNLFFVEDFHESTTSLHWPSLTLRVLLDKLLNTYFEYLSHK